MKMKDLPPSERPYEKCLQYGPKVLSDAELLAAVIRSGVPGMSSVSLSQLLLKQAGPSGLLGLSRMTQKELQEIAGIGPVKAVQIQCILELAVRLSRGHRTRRLDCSDAGTVAAHFMEELRHCTREQVLILMLDTKNRLAGQKMMSLGGTASAPVPIREILTEAIRLDAPGMILIHNHPSGDASPSYDDIRITQALYTAAAMVGLTLVDHIIIGDGTYTSMAGEGKLCPQDPDETVINAAAD